MSLRTAIYNALATDATLTAMLAEKPASLGYGPAIYEKWAPPGTIMPYVNLTYSFAAGADILTRRGTLSIDIFVEGTDTVVIEQINRQIKGALHMLHIYDPEDGPVFLSLENEDDVPEDADTVLHWSTTFLVRHWDKATIGLINQR